MHIRSAALTRSPEIPLGNCIVMLLMTGAFAVQMLVDPGAKHLAGLVLRTWSVSALLGHMWQLSRLGPWLIFVWFAATLSVGVVVGVPAAYMAMWEDSSPG